MIVLKESKTGWIKIDDELELLIDYPTIEQDNKLKKILYEVSFIPELDFENQDNLLGESKAHLMALNSLYFQYYIRYTIKDWKGINDPEGNAVECIIVNNEIEAKLWTKLCRVIPLNDLYEIVKKIKAELEFTEIDKKKLQSQNS